MRTDCVSYLISDVTVDGELSYWSDSINSNNHDISVRSLSNNLLEIGISSEVTMQVSLTASKDNGFYLGLFVTNSEGLSGATSGVIGKSSRAHYMAQYRENLLSL